MNRAKSQRKKAYNAAHREEVKAWTKKATQAAQKLPTETRSIAGLRAWKTRRAKEETL
jgi:hypothetical protein